MSVTAAEADRAHVAAVRAEADRREGLARLAGQVETMRARVESIDDSVARLSERIEDAAARAHQTQAEFETVQGRVGELDQGEVGLDDHHDRTVAALRLADERVAELQSAERGAERQVASLRARIDALSVRLERKDGAAWLTQNHSGAGLFGPVAKLVKVGSGYEAALAAVLGSAADALAADSFGAARSAVAALKQADGGRAALVLGDWPATEDPASAAALPDGARWALDLVEAPPRLRGAMIAMLSGVAVVDDLGRGAGSGGGPPAVARGHASTVTWWAPAGSAAVLTASCPRWSSPRKSTRRGSELAAAETQVAQLGAALSGALTEQSARQDSAEQALAALNESDTAISAMYEQLGRLGQDARTAEEEWSRLLRQREELEAGRAADPRRGHRTRNPAAQRPRDPTCAAAEPSPCGGPPADRRCRREAPAASRWRPGWRCAPPRNEPTRCAGGRIRCAVRPPRNARRGCGPSKRTPRDCARPRWPRRWPTPGGCWPSG